MQATKMHLRQKDGGCQFLGVAENFLHDSWIFRFSQKLPLILQGFSLARAVGVAVGRITIRFFFFENFIFEIVKNLAENFLSLQETDNHHCFFSNNYF